MKKVFYSILFISAAMLTACETSTTDANGGGGDTSEELAKLRSEKRDLELQLAEKDSVLNESIMLFNEIEDNLAMINLKEDEIRFKSKDVELAEDGKQWILQEIQNINYLRESNQKKVGELNSQLKKSNNKITELEKMISTLMSKIESQDEEIDMLRAELEDLDREYVELLEAYEEQTTMTFELMQEMNRVFYAYGTSEELEKAGVIVKEGGFIGIGKKPALKGDFNDEYFTEIDLTKAKSIDVEGGEKIKIITDHPHDAYNVVSTGSAHKVNITDAKNFWKVSKYLVVIVD
jgi:DNA repair exonuclease SbcCD ATPase subunit